MFLKEKMATLVITPAMVGATIQNTFSGNTDSKFQVGDYKYDINIRLDEFSGKTQNKTNSDDSIVNSYWYATDSNFFWRR